MGLSPVRDLHTSNESVADGARRAPDLLHPPQGPAADVGGPLRVAVFRSRWRVPTRFLTVGMVPGQDQSAALDHMPGFSDRPFGFAFGVGHIGASAGAIKAQA